jgi:hypothetical protein
MNPWICDLGWILAGFFFGCTVLQRRHLNAIKHDIELVKLFVSTGGQL